jgi:hypothetical protein
MKWRSWALVIHRDLGYFFTGVIVIYAVSGLAVNHADDWDANFIVEERDVTCLGNDMKSPKNTSAPTW